MTDVDDYWGDDDQDREPAEPDCFGCWDSGFARPRRWWMERPAGARYRAGRGRCASCNPSPRQRRRNAYRARRDAERFQRDVSAGRIVPAGPDDALF